MATVARSLLFVPGHRPERFAKAQASGAHAVIFDLEDAVEPAAKAMARAAVADWLAAGHPAMVRINAADTAWHDEDVRMVRAVSGTQVMLPKADEHCLPGVLASLSGQGVVALVETVSGYLGLSAFAHLAGVQRLAFGSVDFAVDSGIADEGEALTAIRTHLVLASHRAGLAAPIDGVSLEFTDKAIMQADAWRSRQLGFGGKLCIHPRQVAGVNAAYQPTPAEHEWATRVIEAFARSGGAATALDGRMIDKPVVERARQLLAIGPTIDSA